VTTITGRACEASACSVDDAHQRPAADLGQQLVRAAHAARAAGGEHERGDIAARGTGFARGCGRVTISISSRRRPCR
jgi:hypothetical protein